MSDSSYDADLLARVDSLLDHADTADVAPDALAETVRLLQAAAPVPDPAFVQRLERQLAEHHASRSRRRLFPRWVSLAAAGMLAAMLALVLSPRARLATAAALDTAQRVWLQVTSGPDGLTGLQPPPPFTARQLSPLPPDFALVGDRYVPGEAGGNVRGEFQALDPATLQPDPIIQEAIGRERGPAPHLVLAYRSPRGDYLFLYQRAAIPGETLPPGQEHRVDGMPASMQAEGGRRTLTWVAGDTWTELESTLDEAATLAVAEDLAPVDAATAARITPPPPPWGDALRHWGGPVPCDPGAAPLHEPLLGQVSGQRLRGSIWLIIEPIGGRERVMTATGLNDANREAILDAAVAALKDPAHPLTLLPYPSVGRIEYDEAAGCYHPAKVPGYLVIEVWEREVRVGYGGIGAERRAEAFSALEQLRSR